MTLQGASRGIRPGYVPIGAYPWVRACHASLSGRWTKSSSRFDVVIKQHDQQQRWSARDHVAVSATNNNTMSTNATHTVTTSSATLNQRNVC